MTPPKAVEIGGPIAESRDFKLQLKNAYKFVVSN